MDEYYKELNELILSDTLLRPKKNVEANFKEFITDYEDFWTVYNNISDGYTVLLDIKQNEASKIYPNNISSVEYFAQREVMFNKTSEEFHKIKKYIPKEYKVLAEEIECDFTEYIYSKHFNIKTLYDEIIEIYKLGCMPCGWKGEYPQGNFIVFVPQRF